MIIKLYKLLCQLFKILAQNDQSLIALLFIIQKLQKYSQIYQKTIFDQTIIQFIFLKIKIGLINLRLRTICLYKKQNCKYDVLIKSINLVHIHHLNNRQDKQQKQMSQRRQHQRQNQQFQLIISQQNHSNFQSYHPRKQSKQNIDEQNQHNRISNIYKSIIVSMIEDQDMIHDYFISNSNIQEDNNTSNNLKQNVNDKLNNYDELPPSQHVAKKKRTGQFASFFIHQSTTQQDKVNQQQSQTKIKQSSSKQSNLVFRPQLVSSRASNKQQAQNDIFRQQSFTHPQNRQNRSSLQHQQASRLLLEKQKYGLQFQQVYGQIFIYISQASLIGPKKEEYGLFLLTNYRILFFKFLNEVDLRTKKRIDLPFGFIKQIQFTPRRKQIVFHLLYSHFWRFIFDQKQHYDKFKVMIELYSKVQDARSSFAFSYALKYPDFKKFNYEILKQYIRMNLSNVSLVFPNQGFVLAQTYPPYICLPQAISEGSREIVKSFCQNFKGNRLPILTYKYGVKQWSGLWISGVYVQENKINQKQIKTYLAYLRNKTLNKKLAIFDIYFKAIKNIVESKLDFQIQNHYLNLMTNYQIKSGYNLIVQAYLTSKASFFSDVIGSKWYDMVLQLIKSAFNVAERIMCGQMVLIKEDQMNEKALMISALVQLILQPYYRTYKGFRNLVMKQFICFGYKFASRLGNRNAEDECPSFILFLDAVSQLIYLNPLCFEFNYKYLGKLSNLMYTNIFGTFLADTPKQFFQSGILEQTVQVWLQLQNELTKNAFYEIKSGALGNKPYRLSELRFWTQHFSYLTGQTKDIYKIHPLAQTNNDYINLQCLKRKTQNSQLKNQMQKQKLQIKKLQQMIRQRKGIKNSEKK